MKRNMVTFGCGNSSCRVILGVYDEEQITTKVISQIPSYMVRVHQYFYWDILMIYQKLLKGLKEAIKWAGIIHSIGIYTRGVDFALFDNQGLTIQNPLSCRNSIGAEVLEQMSDEQRTYLFRQTDILYGKINSVNMIKGMMEKMQSMFSRGHKLFMIPDILNYLFTGCMVNEPNKLSTTQLMNVGERELGEETLKTMEILSGLFTPIGRHDTAIGTPHSNIKEILGISYDVPVICVPSRDTATAVLAIPAEEKEFLFVSTGTWALVGVELEGPIVNEEMRKRCLTNEIGAFDNITLLRSSTGMFIIQRIKEEYEGEHGVIGWEELSSLGDCHEGTAPLLPVSDSRFSNPVHMSDEIWSYPVKTSQASGGEDWGTIICSFQNSMALGFVSMIQGLKEISEKKKGTVYMVDDGSRNVRLCQMTTDATDKKVVTEGEESTSLGNLDTQLKYFKPEMTVGEVRRLLGTGIESAAYCCGKNFGEALKRYQKPEGQGDLSMDGHILKMCGINKSSFGVPVLRNTQFEVLPDKIRVLLGENGAGKSTLIKILSGAYGREGGGIQLDGRELAPMMLEEVLDAGISVIYQEFNLVPDLPVHENTFIGEGYGQRLLVDHKRAIGEAKGYTKRVGLEVSPKILVRELSVTQGQLVEIAKAVSNHIKVLVLDEPTAAITDKETDTLFGIIRELQREKIGIVYISHCISELFETGDRCMVMRDGEYIGTVKLSEITEGQLTEIMVGHTVSFEKIASETVDMNQVVSEIEKLRYREFLEDISSELHKGEILGFAGLMEASRTEVTKCMMGTCRKNGGIVTYKDGTLSDNLSRNVEKGIVYPGEGRKDEGFVLMRSVMDNITLPNSKQLAKPFIRKREMADRAKNYIKSLRIKTHTRLVEVKSLSGGNQRKVVIAKWLYSNAGVYIFGEPTRGIDVRAHDEIYNVMYDLVNQGASIIMISSDLVEVLEMCDWVAAMREGTLGAISDNSPDLMQETILKYAMQEGL